MREIIPAILERDFEDIVKKVGIISGVSSWVQVDVVDGAFAPNKTWPFTKSEDGDLAALVHEEQSLPEWESVSYEFDLMVANPRAVADTFVTAGASRVVVHYSSFKDDNEREVFLRDFKKKYNLPEPLSVGLGLAIGADVNVSEALRYKDTIDFVQLMGIEHIGTQGEHFYEKTIERVAELHRLAPDLIISVDGGVNEGNAEALANAGVTRLVVGSEIWKADDPVGEFEHLCDKIEP